MKKYSILSWLSALILLTLLPACAAPAEETAVPPNAAPPTVEPSASASTPPAPTATPLPPTSMVEVSFSQDVMPLLQDYCVSCHGTEKVSAALDVTTYENLMKGSKRGPVITPGNADDSLFILLIEKGKMPKRGEKMTPEQIQLLREWVNAGAPNN